MTSISGSMARAEGSSSGKSAAAGTSGGGRAYQGSGLRREVYVGSTGNIFFLLS